MLTSQSLKMNSGVHKRSRIVMKWLQYESASRSWTDKRTLAENCRKSFNIRGIEQLSETRKVLIKTLTRLLIWRVRWAEN